MKEMCGFWIEPRLREGAHDQRREPIPARRAEDSPDDPEARKGEGAPSTLLKGLARSNLRNEAELAETYLLKLSG
jgi:hypothetical protein